MKITSEIYLRMLRAGVENLRVHRVEVNDLNVFPVPDGDTGDNMLMTVEAVLRVSAVASGAEVDAEANLVTHESGTGKGLAEVSREVADAMLLAARGNSGVILSQIFKGMADGFSNYTEAGVSGLNKAMQEGVKAAYGAVAEPVEGTMLSVLKAGAEYADESADEQVESYFDNLVSEMKLALERTTTQMKLLEENGVVDSGGAGLYYVFEGMRRGLRGEVIGEGPSAGEVSSGTKVDVSLFTENSELEYGYCTEFLLRLQTAKVAEIEKFDLEGLIKYLEQVGNSVVAFRNGSIVKVHVHTKTPGEVLNYCQGFGEFLTLKIENMTLQHNRKEAQSSRDGGFRPSFVRVKPKKFGLVVVASGEGVKKVFRELGCDVVIDGGKSMNPSTEDFLRAFKECNAENIFVLPNNKNTIMTAEQAAEIYSKTADVRVLPTRDIGQGYGAVGAYDISLESPEAISAEMMEAVKATRTGFVSQVSRTTEIEGAEVREGEYFGFSEERDGSGKMVVESRADAEEVLLELAEKMGVSEADVVMLVKGSTKLFTDDKNRGVKSSTKPFTGTFVEDLKRKFKTKFPEVELIMIDGEQPIYNYILIIE